MKKRPLLIIFSLSFVFFASSQTNIENLENKLKSAEGNSKYEILYKLSKAYLAKSPKKSIDYGNQALKLAEKLNSKNKQANALNIIGTANYELGKHRNAIKNYEKEYEIRLSLNQKTSSTKTLINIGSIYESWGKKSKAISTYQEALNTSKNIRNAQLTYKCYESLIDIYGNEKKYKDAYETMREYMAYRGATNVTYERKKIAILETKYQEEKKLKEEVEEQLVETDSSLNVVTDEKNLLEVEKQVLVQDTAYKSTAITDLTIETIEQEETIKEQEEKVRRQRQWIIAITAFFLVVIVFSILLYKQYSAKKKAYKKLELQNMEILEKNEEIKVQAEQLIDANGLLTQQRDEILYANNQITDSIMYASRIQKAMLPKKEVITEMLPEHMVLFKPRDIVSGDFYWYRKIKNFAVFVAADCTGHGVPGAFMSMLGISFLNDIVSKSRFDKPNEILEKLRKKVKNALHQTGKANEATDGMDISFCILDTENNQLQFAGAYNPLYLVRDNKLQIIKADRQPIAIHLKERDFTNHEIDVQKGDCLYMFSDGYKDQFGGEKGQKFKSKKFDELLLNIHQKPMEEQKEILEKEINKWMGGIHEQIDDILVFGVRV